MARGATEQANLDAVLTMYREVLIAMDADAVDRHIPPDYIQHSSLAASGREALKDFLRKVRAESPDARQTIHRAFADGDHVVIRWIFVFHRPEGRSMRIEELAYQRWKGDKIAQEQFFYDPVQFKS